MKISISKQELASLPPAQFSGSIVVVDDPSLVDEAVERLREADLIGFDTETRPSFKKGQNFHVALLQLSSRETTFLFRLNKIGFPTKLRELLEDETKIKIGLSIHDDFRNLRRKFEFEPKGFVELQQFVTKWNIEDKSLSKIFAILFGMRLSKGQRLSNWEAEQLAESQQHYAALDALACINIFEYLRDGNFTPALSPYKIEN